jgi:anaerobic dimethyl sulfoxide reductase subunit B (iron-sulfur subunit)
MSCNHCEEPVCVAVCPKGALYKDEATGIVLQDLDRCVGCRRCEWACPYGAIQFRSDTGQVTKCDMCFDRQQEGLEPACVSTCAMSAITVVDGFDVLESGQGAPPCFADPAMTTPAIKFVGLTP